MKFNLTYMGPESLFNLRRDFFLAVQDGLRSLGHEVFITATTLDKTAFNLIVGAYFLKPESLRSIQLSGVEFAHINTEIISGDLLNFNPKKVDFLGSYLPSLQAGKFVWDVVEDNMPEHRRYGTSAHFCRWGWTPILEDIIHRETKDLDFYFFGSMSERRVAVVADLRKRGFHGIADGTCPYFVRNDRISRAKICLNLRQDDKYTHVNAFRICYLANNSCSIVGEAELDPSGYLAHTVSVVDPSLIADAMESLLEGEKWKLQAAESYELFLSRPMKDLMAKLLDESL